MIVHFSVVERAHIFTMYRNKICILILGLFQWLLFLWGVRVYDSDFVISLNSTLTLIHIYVFECVSEFNFLEHLSLGMMYAKIFPKSKKKKQ